MGDAGAEENRPNRREYRDVCPAGLYDAGRFPENARLWENCFFLALLLSILLADLPTTYCHSNYTDEAGNEVNLTGLASVSFALFLSSRCKSTVVSLASALVFCIAPVVLSMTVPGALSTWLCSLLPASGTSIQASIL